MALINAGEPGRDLSRRRLLRLAGLTGVGAFITSCQRGTIIADPSQLGAVGDPRVATQLAAQATAASRPSAGDVTPEPLPLARDFGFDTDIRLVPNGQFYTMKFNPTPPPEIDVGTYRLTIDGLVATPLSLSLAELQAMQADQFIRTLECISNPAGGDLVGNAVWKGVKLAHVLAQAGVDPTGTELKLESADGYDTGIPLTLAMDPQSYLAYEMNGRRLPPNHGYPVRCLFPGRYGQKQPKWLTSITVQGTPHKGHWEAMGWSHEAAVQINSRFDAPNHRAMVAGPVVVRGIAFSDLSGVARVQIIVDNKETHEARLAKAPAPFGDLAWTEWEWTWTDPPPGKHSLLAKATDGSGRSQRHARLNLLGGTFPDGTTEMDKLSVQVPG